VPTASDELRKEFMEPDTEGAGDVYATDLLAAAGIRLLPSWEWVVPDDVGLTAKLYRAIKFMADEWDYGGWFWEFEYDQLVADGVMDKYGKRLGGVNHEDGN
jgi:hypothetical protein